MFKVQLSSAVLQKIRRKSLPSSRMGKSHELSDLSFLQLNSARLTIIPYANHGKTNVPSKGPSLDVT